MTDVKKLQEERIKLFHDVYDNKIPKRVPLNISIPFEPTAQFGGIDLIEAQWNSPVAEGAIDKLCQTLYSDVCPCGGSMRYPSFYQVLESQSFVMGSNGFIQHPEVTGMLPEDYDYLIEKPYDCIIERVIPRQYKGLSGDPMSTAINFAKSFTLYNNDFGELGAILNKINGKYGYYPGMPFGGGGFTEAPFDFLADQLRSFKGISADIRRRPEKVAEACEALYPIVLKKGMPSKVSNYESIGMPLHMPTFMREKDFAKLWWPSFKKLVDAYASMGIHCSIFCEDDWTRYLDYLYELPTDTIMMFEYGDIGKIKEKLGKKHIITGLYPMLMLLTHTKQECIDKAKEIIDVLAPGGKYMFAMDKVPLSLSDVNMENFSAVSEYIRDNAAYQNAGETAGMQFDKNDYKALPSREIESKYYRTWEQYKKSHPKVSEFGQVKLQRFEEEIFQYLIYLLV